MDKDYEAESEDMIVQNILMSDGKESLGNLMPAHCAFQRRMVERHMGKCTESKKVILNVGCKEDPAGIGDWENSVNMDVCEYDHSTQQSLKEVVKNFIQADYLKIEFDNLRDCIILGEVLEHCTFDIGYEFMYKIHADLKEDGLVIVTVPQDDREKYEQYARSEEYLEYAPGITSWHQTVWTKELLDKMLEDVGFEMIDYNRAWWFKSRGIFWHLFIARKI